MMMTLKKNPLKKILKNKMVSELIKAKKEPTANLILKKQPMLSVIVNYILENNGKQR